MNRRAFFGAFAAVLAAPMAALATKFEPMPDVMIWNDGSFVTPNGECITSLQQVYGDIYVFTKSSVYVLTERQIKSMRPSSPRWLGRVTG